MLLLSSSSTHFLSFELLFFIIIDSLSTIYNYRISIGGQRSPNDVMLPFVHPWVVIVATFTELIRVGTRVKRGSQDGHWLGPHRPRLDSSHTYTRLTTTPCQVPTRLGGREAVGKHVEPFATRVSPSSARAVSADSRHMQSLEGGTPTLGSP